MFLEAGKGKDTDLPGASVLARDPFCMCDLQLCKAENFPVWGDLLRES